MKRRVMITGMGVISSIGIGKTDFWNNLVHGVSGISELSGFDTSQYPCHRAGEIKDFDAAQYIAVDKIKDMDRGSQFGVIASEMALQDAGVYLNDINKERFGVLFGTTNGEAQVLQQINDKKYVLDDEVGAHKLCRYYPAFQMNANVARALRLGGDNLMLPNACAAGNFAIGYAFDLIQAQRLDYALTGGVDPFSRIAFTGFNRLFAVAPEKSQPFDSGRKGIMVGEGAGVLFMETLDGALNRGAHIYAEVLGYGVSCDAFHITNPHPEAKGVILAMKKALADSGVSLEDVDYISPHGTGTHANDKAETIALKTVLGKRYKDIPVSSIKSMIGHTMGAASAIEALTCALILENGVIPPTINYEKPDPECDLDCVPNVPRKIAANIVLNNAQAFGGNNSCLVLKKYSANS